LTENSPGEEPQYLKPGEVYFLIPDQDRWEEHRQSLQCKTGANIFRPETRQSKASHWWAARLL